MQHKRQDRGIELARLALACGIAGFLVVPGLGGLVALTLGWAAGFDLGQRRHAGGRSLARVAMGVGAVNVAIVVGIFLAFPVRSPAQRHAGHFRQTLSSPREPLEPPRPAPRPVRTAHLGGLEWVEVTPPVRSLGVEIERQCRTASRAGQRVLLWIVSSPCPTCEAIATSFCDSAVQGAMESHRIVRLDARAFQPELERMHLPTDHTPGLALFGESCRPVDYIHAGEWDRDEPSSIAPVLKDFLGGELDARRDPWRGGSRPDAAPL